MKSLLDVPSWQSGPVRLADHAELMSLEAQDGTVSKRDLVSELCRLADEDDTRVEGSVDEVFAELSQRFGHMGDMAKRYPFELSNDLLKRRGSHDREPIDYLYLFLLLTTRMDMKKQKVQPTSNGNRVDGTQLFERLCLEVARRYLGGSGTDPRVGTMLFGTSGAKCRYDTSQAINRKVFENAVGRLCVAFGEGGGFKKKGSGAVMAKDDKLDVVVWRGFSDKREGKMALFGQCKTGDSWDMALAQLQPDGFCKKWMEEQPVVVPLRAFFLADRVIPNWYNKSIEAGILFDRCRIMDYADEIPADILEQCAEWTRAAMQQHGLKL